METFVVRVFVPTDAGGVPLCGILERPGSGRAESFQSAQELIQLLLDELERSRRSSPERAPAS